jgi:hypothetical protein
MKKSFNVSLFVILAITGIVTLSFQVKKINVSGTWNMAVQTDGGSGNPVLVLKHMNDSVLSGTYSGQFGTSDLKGILRGNKISLSITISDFTMDYIGTVDSDNMKGKVVFGDYGEGTFTGKKKTE